MIVNERTPLFTELIVEESAVVSGGTSPSLIFNSMTQATLYNADGHGKVVRISVSDINSHDANHTKEPQLFLPTSTGNYSGL